MYDQYSTVDFLKFIESLSIFNVYNNEMCIVMLDRNLNVISRFTNEIHL